MGNIGADTDKIMANYTRAYQKLYKRTPKDLRVLDENWVIVNGARMRIMELEQLTYQLQREYDEAMGHQRRIVSKLIKWFRGN